MNAVVVLSPLAEDDLVEIWCTVAADDIQAADKLVDEDVLTWFKECGPRYQSRMNAVLRSYMHSRSRGRARP